MEQNPGGQEELPSGAVWEAALGTCDSGKGRGEQSKEYEFIPLTSSGTLGEYFSFSVPVSSVIKQKRDIPSLPTSRSIVSSSHCY